MNKAELRKRMREVRDAVEQRAEKSAYICGHILKMPEYRDARCVMAYRPIRSEVDLTALIDAALKEGKRVCVPVCLEDGQMDAVAYTGKETLQRNAFGVEEPAGPVVPPEEIDLMLCPGLAFDANGGRMGYGKGYYDRYLEKVHAFWAGICYTECIVTAVPAQAHDVPMKALVTQAGVMRIGGNQ